MSGQGSPDHPFQPRTPGDDGIGSSTVQTRDVLLKDVWGEDKHVRVSSSYAPLGKVEPVEGGFRLSGRWGWSSGCDHCSWVLLGAIVPEEGFRTFC